MTDHAEAHQHLVRAAWVEWLTNASYAGALENVIVYSDQPPKGFVTHELGYGEEGPPIHATLMQLQVRNEFVRRAVDDAPVETKSRADRPSSNRPIADDLDALLATVWRRVSSFDETEDE